MSVTKQERGEIVIWLTMTAICFYLASQLNLKAPAKPTVFNTDKVPTRHRLFPRIFPRN